MKWNLRRFCGLSLSASMLAVYLPPVPAAPLGKLTPQQTLNDQRASVRLMPRQGTMRWSGGFLLAAFQDEQPNVPAPQQPLVPQPQQPLLPEQPLTEAPTPSEAGQPTNIQIPSLEQVNTIVARELGMQNSAASGTTGGEASVQGATDLGQLLQQSNSVDTIDVQRRSPVALDPNIRGYKQGQIYTQADGTYWLPARQDMDTMLSKIDPTMIENVVVLSGPYGVQYGPGLSFVAIDIADTPRYECGPEHHARILGNVRTNGGQLYGRTTAYGGDYNTGYRISYGDKKGSDYLSGNDTQIPSSYDTNDVWANWGYSINPDQKLELGYIRYEQSDTEYPDQFFNIDDLNTDGFNARLIDEGAQGPWSRLVIDGWWNRTRFNGDNFGKHNPRFHEVERTEFAVDQFLQDPDRSDSVFPPPAFRQTHIDAETDGDLTSTGTRAMATFGDPQEQHMNLGADFRYIEQEINERIFVNTIQPFPIRTNLPRSWAVDPGLFAEYGHPWTDFWTVKVGTRIDFYKTKADRDFVFTGSNADLDQEDELYAAYLTNEVELNCNWTATASFGFGERAPTLIERYSDGLFLGIAQSGFTRVRGTPTLDKESDYQVDLGLRADYGYWRGHAGVYHAWIHDYVTLNGSVVRDPFFESARLFDYINTSWATLAGFELSGEYDWSDYLSPFATMKYVDGRDQEIDAPLPQIPPLDSVVGIRLHEPSRARLWSVELAARIVDNQDRLGTVSVSRRPGLETTDIIEEATPGFTVWYLRGYYNYSRNLSFVAGVENLFDRNYQEHLDLRLRGPASFPSDPTRVLAPGISPYFGVDWTF